MPVPVAVVGAGLAGCAACLTLAAQGVPTVWIAPRGPLADKPGESLAAAAGVSLQRLGLEHLLADAAHRRVEATFTCWGSDALLERSGIAHPGGLGHVVHRGRLEAAMAAEAARRPGIAVVDGMVTSFRRRTGGWRVEMDGAGPIDAAFLVDATGRGALIGRKLVRLHRGDRLVAAYAFLEQVDTEVDPTPATLVEAVETGWWYATLLADRRLALNYYSDPDLMPPGLGRDVAAWQALADRTRYVARWIESAGFALSQPPRLASAGTSWLSDAAGPDWIAIGDAAAAFDPLSAHGMTTALWTGIEGAQAVRRALQGDAEGLESYAARVLQGVDRFRTGRAQIHAREIRFPDQPFWSRRQGVSATEGSPAPDAGPTTGRSPGPGGDPPRQATA